MTLNSPQKGAFFNAAQTGYRPKSRAWLALALTGAVAAFAVLQIAIWRINGLWWDELCSLWASDPSNSLRTNFIWRMAPDTLPPGYYCLLYVARLLVKDGRVAAIILNCVLLALAAAVVVVSARRARLVPLALLSIGAFLLSGPVVYYTSEARPYLIAFALTFVLSWRVSLRLAQQESQPFSLDFVLLGILAALIHLYAALFCCCLATGMIAVAMKFSRRDLTWDGIGLGLSAGITACVWLMTVRNSFGRVAWIRFNPHNLLDTITSVFSLNGGFALFAILFALALLPRNCRTKLNDRQSLTIAFSVAYFLFFVIPILISFKQPVIVDRYWLIGSPGLIVFVLFQLKALYSHFVGGEAANECRRTRYIFAALAAVWGLIGIDSAYARFDGKQIWRGLNDVKPWIAECPMHSVHVGLIVVQKNNKFQLGSNYDVSGLFGALTDEPADKFVSVGGDNGQLLVARDAKCPVLGWAEHVDESTLHNMSDTDLLRLLDVEALNGEVTIRRHKTGFVVLRR